VSPTFTHGKSAVVYQDDNDLTGYLRSMSSSAEIDTAESTTFSDDDKTYVVGMQDQQHHRIWHEEHLVHLPQR
jgi:hypothetical protein